MAGLTSTFPFRPTLPYKTKPISLSSIHSNLFGLRLCTPNSSNLHLALSTPRAFISARYGFDGGYATSNSDEDEELDVSTQQIKAREQQQQLQMQQLQLIQQRNAQLQRSNPNHPPLGGSINAMNSGGIMGQPSASVLAMKMYEEGIKNPNSVDSEASPALMDPNRMALLKSATNHQGPLVQGNVGNMSSALQQMQGRPQLPTKMARTRSKRQAKQATTIRHKRQKTEVETTTEKKKDIPKKQSRNNIVKPFR